MKSNIKSENVLSSMVWKFAERICAQMVTFIVSIVLARILTPNEYGIIAITTVFITICNVFVTSGFGVALIQKKDADELDFSTMLFFCFGFSILLYVALFFSAPTIAEFYSEPILTSVIRVMSLRLPIAAINSIQQAWVAKKMIFKKFFWATLIGTVISALVGILLAVNGFGVWALVVQYLVNAFIDTVALGLTIHWRPIMRVSIQRLRTMFRFAWQILCSDLLHTLYTQLRNLLIGKYYSTDQLAYYNKGQQIPHLFVTNLGVAVSSVLFPAMSAKQDNKEQLRSALKRSISTGTYFMMPMMAGLAAVARPLTVLLLTEKWIDAVQFIQLACLEFCVEPWASANLQALKAKGKGNEYLTMEVIKKIAAVGLLVSSIPFGVFAIVVSGVVYAYLDVLINTIVSGKYFEYGFFQQLKDITPNIIMSLIMFGIVSAVDIFGMSEGVTLVVQVCLGCMVYLIMSLITKNESFSYTLNMLHRILCK